MERARELAEMSPVLPELLDFYQQIARFQCSIAEGRAPANLGALLALIGRGTSDPMHAFFARVMLQVEAQRTPAADGVEPRCPRCAARPVAAVVRGDDDRRLLLCGLCFTEWAWGGHGCPNCGEADADQLRSHTDDEFPHIRLEACGTCRVYLKTIDVTSDARAVPEVDELASVPLDMWAAEQGYTKLQINLFGM